MSTIGPNDDQFAELRRILIEQAADDLINNPRMIDLINERLRSAQFDAQEAARNDPDKPVDGGLLNLVGLGENAIQTLPDAYSPPPLPRFDEQVTSERIQAGADLYYLYQHERLGVFRAVIKLQELFKNGSVKLSDGSGAVNLYQFDRQKVLRYTRTERFQAYRRVFGYTDVSLPSSARANEDFHRLFVNFSNATAQFYRDQRVSEVIQGGPTPNNFGSVAVVRRAGLDLRNNLKDATYGNVNVLRTEVMQLLDAAFEILNSQDVLRLYGADDGWDVISEIKRRELKEKSMISQRSRMALTGHNVLDWLAGPGILTISAQMFQLQISTIRDDVEEWLTSAESVGLNPTRSGRSSTKVVPFEQRRTAS